MNSNEPDKPQKPKTKLVAAIVAVITAIIAAVPPLVANLRPPTSNTVSGHGNVVGSTINNTSTTNTYANNWFAGTRMILGLPPQVEGTPGSGPNPSRGSVEPHPPVGSAAFDADTFVVSVRGAQRKQDGSISIVLSVRNKTSDQLFLATNYDVNSLLFDETIGAATRVSNAGGLQHTQSHRTAETDYTPIPAQAQVPFALTSAGAELKSSSLKLSLNMLVLENGKSRRITVPLDVTLTQI